MSFLDTLIYGYRQFVKSDNSLATQRSRLKVVGGTLTDDGTNTVLTITAGSGTPGGVNGDLQTNNAGVFGGLTPGAGVATFLATPSGANLATALTSALPASKGGTGLTSLGAGVATFLGTPSGANLASALTSALPLTKGGTGLTAVGTAYQHLRTNLGATAFEWATPSTDFNDSTPGTKQNIQSQLPPWTGTLGQFTRAITDNTKKGIVNLASDTNNELGLQDAFGVIEDWGVGVGDMPSVTARFGFGGGYRGNARGQGGFAHGISAFADGEGSACHGRSNVAGVYAKIGGMPNITIAAAGQTITRSVGDWVAEGFVVGANYRCKTPLNNVRGDITAVTATVLTVANSYGVDDLDLGPAAVPLVDEGPVTVSSTIYVEFETRYAFCVGFRNNARARGSFCTGQLNSVDVKANYTSLFGFNNGAIAVALYASAFGNQNTLSGPGACAFGQVNEAGENSMAVGFSSTATGAGAFAGSYHANASQSYTFAFGNYASSTVQNAVAFGYKAKGDQFGCFAHSSNEDAAGTQGFKALDLEGTGAAGAATNLQNVLGELEVQNSKTYRFRITVIGSKTTASVCKMEEHLLFIKTTGGAMTIISDTVISAATDLFATAGWTLALTAIGGAQPYGLRITCTPAAAETVKFAARVEWMAIPGA